MLVFSFKILTINGPVLFTTAADLKEFFCHKSSTVWPHDPFKYIFISVLIHNRSENLKQVACCP